MTDVSTSSQPSPVGTQPMRLQIRHFTRYVYEGDARDSFNDARLCPITDGRQRCEDFQLVVRPKVPVNTYFDFYQNRVDHFELPDPHGWLEVESRAVVHTRPDLRGEPPEAVPPSLLNDPGIEDNYFDFLAASHYVTLEPEAWREAIDVLPNGVTCLWRDSLAIGRHVFQTFTYTPAATQANTRMIDALRSRRGVCQDYAHVMLAMCRTQGIPSRYVSGYFFNERRQPGEVEASHAWVEIFLPGYGWKGYDPTHDRLADTRYVKLAVGRDYADIRPLAGTYRGKGTKELIVEVEVAGGLK